MTFSIPIDVCGDGRLLGGEVRRLQIRVQQQRPVGHCGDYIAVLLLTLSGPTPAHPFTRSRVARATPSASGSLGCCSDKDTQVPEVGRNPVSSRNKAKQKQKTAQDGKTSW